MKLYEYFHAWLHDRYRVDSGYKEPPPKRYKSYMQRDWKWSVGFGALFVIGLIADWNRWALLVCFLGMIWPSIKDGLRKFIRDAQKDDIGKDD